MFFDKGVDLSTNLMRDAIRDIDTYERRKHLRQNESRLFDRRRQRDMVREEVWPHVAAILIPIFEDLKNSLVSRSIVRQPPCVISKKTTRSLLIALLPDLVHGEYHGSIIPGFVTSALFGSGSLVPDQGIGQFSDFLKIRRDADRDIGS